MIIVDTGFWLALANVQDQFHDKARRRAECINEKLITTWPVITETCHMLLHFLGNKSLLAFGKSLSEGACELFDLNAGHFEGLHSLMKKYADLPMDLADASLVVLAEHLGHGRILTTDNRDFKTYKFKNHKPFQNLLLEN